MTGPDDRQDGPAVRGTDRSMSGAGAPPPRQSAADIVELRVVVNAALEHNQDVSEMLADALSGQPGSLAQITVAVNTLRFMADELEVLTRRETSERTPGQKT
jgi:hypothetical protein